MTGNRVLIVEDEIVVVLFIEDMLTEFGYRVAGVVSHPADALAHPRNYDLAVLDVHLNGKTVFEFADRLADENIPFVFATGYGERGIPERFAGRLVLQKPYMPEDLKQSLNHLVGQAA